MNLGVHTIYTNTFWEYIFCKHNFSSWAQEFKAVSGNFVAAKLVACLKIWCFQRHGINSLEGSSKSVMNVVFSILLCGLHMYAYVF